MSRDTARIDPVIGKQGLETVYRKRNSHAACFRSVEERRYDG